ncbi:hypothetical protein [Noviherbaspirillum sp. ST 5-3]|uniref:hypothetical protein n=2 Tax=Oxalobacteraceae TaxID=75682 RepID=UPI003916D68B
MITSLSVNPTSAPGRINDTDDIVSPETIDKLSRKLGLQPTNADAMKVEAPQLQASQDRRLDIKHIPLIIAPDSSSIQLRRAPTCEMFRMASTETISHGCSFIGTPGEDGYQYFSISGDGDRAMVAPSEILAALDKKIPGALKQGDGGAAVRKTLEQLKPSQQMQGVPVFVNRERFYSAYMENRLAGLGYAPGSDVPKEVKKAVHDEIMELNKLVPKNRWELQFRESNGPDVEKRGGRPNLPELDCRAFGDPKHKVTKEAMLDGKVHKFPELNLRATNTDPLYLVETKLRLQAARLYTDKLHGRNGTSIPFEIDESDGKPLSDEALMSIAAKTPKYNLTVPLADGEGNCATGNAHMHRLAGRPDSENHPPSNYAFGAYEHLNDWAAKAEPPEVRPAVVVNTKELAALLEKRVQEQKQQAKL